MNTLANPPTGMTRTAGFLYLTIFVLGLWSELAVRSAIYAVGDPATTAANILNGDGLFVVSFAADAVMVLCDVALAILLYRLLRPVGKTLALTASAFRLTQSAILGANLLFHYAAVLLIYCPDESLAAFTPEQVNTLVYFFITLQSAGYDFGLLFFGVSCILLGTLIFRSGYFPKWLGVLVVAAGPVYLAGSTATLIIPAAAEVTSWFYVIPVLSELSLALWLLFRGVNVEGWRTSSLAAA